METAALQELRTFAETTARNAGALLAERFGGSLQIDKKSSAADMVTQADRDSERLITEAISSRYPDHAILGEEQGHTPSSTQSRYTWVVDPLDGTTNFVHGLPLYAVSIALAEEDEPLLGVVYLPSLDILYSAVKGGGALRNGKPLHPSSAAELSESVVATGFPYDKATSLDNNLVFINALLPQIQGLRRLGAAAYDICLVAEGGYDAYWELKVKIWDVLAGICIAREAGARAQYVRSGEYVHILAAAPALYAPFRDELLQHGNYFHPLAASDQ